MVDAKVKKLAHIHGGPALGPPAVDPRLTTFPLPLAFNNG